ncbi:glycosyltransferase family 4 protein [Methyloversatilis sp. XJ19-49]|uniref:glycosyltransferase family 4 protein n=1 Tax=Methyloversatilis sp. XJ19-49 TaxID=2963429 RepID=UPI00211C6D48|nr:glycosyltransferase family 4 protein [Methyloversatilis sp. XJ19-49]MCQ9376821.1 glycosyltransferase family 4 protein [Methyloversatilis sp. XJ19-49]
MKVLHAYNLHRGGGGADNATRATMRVLRDAGVDIEAFERDSRDIPQNLAGKVGAFASGIYAHSAVREFAARLDAFRPDIVHVHELYPLISPWVLPACSCRGIPVVMSVYDYRLSCPTHNHFYQGEVCTGCVGGRDYRCIVQNCRGSLAESVAFGVRNMVARHFGLFSKHVGLYITPTRFAAEWLVAHCAVPANRTAVVPCVIDIPPDTVDPVQGRYVAFAGRFVEEKGIEIALEAARLADVPIGVAGDALHYKNYREDARTHFVVTKDKHDLAAFYRGARCFVMPSIWFETFGIVVAESMSHGVPVLASRIGALAETTRDGVSGLHFEPGNVQDLAAKMRRLWDDDVLCRQLGQGARAQVESMCTDVHHGDAMLAAYRSVLEAR